jgi:predicted ATPase
MLTRLEVDGFKNLLDVCVDFGPFTCIAGENGTGKSNLFDAIQFLSLLSGMSMIEAAQEVRGAKSERVGDPRDLFWNGYAAGEHRLQLAAEMIVPHDIEDDFGQPAKASITFLRYELGIGYQPPSGIERVGRLVLLHESLRHINLGDASAHLRFPHSAQAFRKHVVRGRRSGGAFISTAVKDGETVVSIHQDGGSRGQPRPAAASRAPGTVVSTVSLSDDPTILAARREMQSWRRLALEPAALRTPDRYVDPRSMGANGSHLAGALYRIATATDGEPADTAAVYARITGRLADLSGVGVRSLHVDADDVRELLTIYLSERGDMSLPARSLSEGTLRFLALCVLLEDPAVEGLICMEEPENGIHPANVGAVVRLLEDVAVDPQLETGVDNPFRQVIVNTHSPVVVQLVKPEDLLFATTRLVPHARTRGASALRLRPYVGTWRARSSAEPAMTMGDILPYLTKPPGAQLELQMA